MRSRPQLPGGPYLVVGLARSGVAAALMLRARGEEAIGVDAGAPGGTQALVRAGVECHLGEDGVALLERVRAVVKSPGVPAQAPVIAAARARGMEVLGELELGWRTLSNEFVAVTGTNGKTTTVELIGHIHREAGLPVAVAGNVGVAVSGLVGNVEERVVIVCEVSSFQLEDTIAFAPEAAVLLNVTPDHLDRHGTFAAYTKAKLEIFARQGNEDIAVVPAKLHLDFERPPNFASDPPANLAVDPRLGAARRVTFGVQPDPRGGPRSTSVTLRAGVICWQGAPLLRAEEIHMRGRHNVENAMAAAAVCLARGIKEDAVRAGLRSFAGVPHRMEEIAHRDGVLYVNDSKATNVSSSLVALDAFPAGVVHLILGGQAKGQDFSALRAPVEKGCRAVYLIGEDAPALSAALKGVGVPVHECGELEQAVARAREAVRRGDVVLLSPACASYDQFADFEARGERFRELVQG